MNAKLLRKSVVLFVLAILFLTACTSSPKTPVTPEPPTTPSSQNPVDRSSDRKIIFIDGIDTESTIDDCNNPNNIGLVNKDGTNRVQWIVNHLTTNDEVKKQVPLYPNRDFLYMSYSGKYCEKDGSSDFRRPKYAASDTCGGVIDAAEKLNTLIASLDSNTKIDLIGHSMGGLVAAEWLWAHPKIQPRVNSVVTFDSPLRGMPDKKPFGVATACDTSSSLSWNDLWCQNYADREKCASIIVSTIANLGTTVPFFTMDSSRQDLPSIEAVPAYRTTLLSSKSTLHCKFGYPRYHMEPRKNQRWISSLQNRFLLSSKAGLEY